MVEGSARNSRYNFPSSVLCHSLPNILSSPGACLDAVGPRIGFSSYRDEAFASMRCWRILQFPLVYEADNRAAHIEDRNLFIPFRQPVANVFMIKDITALNLPRYRSGFFI